MKRLKRGSRKRLGSAAMRKTIKRGEQAFTVATDFESALKALRIPHRERELSAIRSVVKDAGDRLERALTMLQRM